MQNQKNKIIALIIAANLLTASVLVYAQGTTSGSLEVLPCTLNCFIFEVPSSQNIHAPINLNTTSRIPFRFNYDLGNGIYVRDLRTVTGWTIDVRSSNLTNSTDSTKFIPYSNIGVLSFNNNATTTIDTNLGDNTVISTIDPTTLLPPRASEPFDQAAFDVLDPTNPGIEPLFTFFSGLSASQSDPVTIMQAPLSSLRPGTYTMGLGLLIKTPNNPADTLVDGTYQLELYFTITT